MSVPAWAQGLGAGQTQTAHADAAAGTSVVSARAAFGSCNQQGFSKQRLKPSYADEHDWRDAGGFHAPPEDSDAVVARLTADIEAQQKARAWLQTFQLENRRQQRSHEEGGEEVTLTWGDEREHYHGWRIAEEPNDFDRIDEESEATLDGPPDLDDLHWLHFSGGQTSPSAGSTSHLSTGSRAEPTGMPGRANAWKSGSPRIQQPVVLSGPEGSASASTAASSAVSAVSVVAQRDGRAKSPEELRSLTRSNSELAKQLRHRDEEIAKLRRQLERRNQENARLRHQQGGRRDNTRKELDSRAVRQQLTSNVRPRQAVRSPPRSQSPSQKAQQSLPHHSAAPPQQLQLRNAASHQGAPWRPARVPSSPAMVDHHSTMAAAPELSAVSRQQTDGRERRAAAGDDGGGGSKGRELSEEIHMLRQVVAKLRGQAEVALAVEAAAADVIRAGGRGAAASSPAEEAASLSAGAGMVRSASSDAISGRPSALRQTSAASSSYHASQPGSAVAPAYPTLRNSASVHVLSADSATGAAGGSSCSSATSRGRPGAIRVMAGHLPGTQARQHTPAAAMRPTLVASVVGHSMGSARQETDGSLSRRSDSIQSPTRQALVASQPAAPVSSGRRVHSPAGEHPGLTRSASSRATLVAVPQSQSVGQQPGPLLSGSASALAATPATPSSPSTPSASRPSAPKPLTAAVAVPVGTATTTATSSVMPRAPPRVLNAHSSGLSLSSYAPPSRHTVHHVQGLAAAGSVSTLGLLRAAPGPSGSAVAAAAARPPPSTSSAQNAMQPTRAPAPTPVASEASSRTPSSTR
eukprot:TRINITY_DN59720_c0_g2_i1.p1 TRINITY_DN59720_c0_g2~~TRINITY_DN59720_c0_g2_i1.p1  ORF type:complete len:807 (+),score=144.02 TRINITY_DN59720_c0_g2_i1:127-2547(+)